MKNSLIETNIVHITLLNNVENDSTKQNQHILKPAKDIERRVVEAGGNIQGALVASLSWTSADDLDLHMSLPGGGEISYARKKVFPAL